MPSIERPVLRLANEHETAAFFLVERTLQRARPQVGPLGLKAVDVPEGRIERNPLGRLRFRFDGSAVDYEPENRVETRPLSEQELSLWNGLQRVVSATKPVADSEWNLVSMRIGPRILRRLPLGGVVTYLPTGTPPFRGSFAPVVPEVQPEPSLPSESQRLAAIDAFLAEYDGPWGDVPSGEPWKPQTTGGRPTNHVLTTTLGHGRKRGKFHRCPLCHTPVIKGLFNPRIPYGPLRPGSGVIRDLRGGYLSRLRETYLVSEPSSLVQSGASASEAPAILGSRSLDPPLVR